jgi:hypothetical protein
MFGDTAVFRRNDAIEHRAVDLAAVLVNTDVKLYFGVNRVGARIWSLLEQPRRVADLVRILTHEFAVDDVACRHEIEVFLRQLMMENLVVRCTEIRYDDARRAEENSPHPG